MSIPLHIFLILYLLFLIAYFIFAAIILYYLARYGGMTFVSFSMFFLFAGVSVVILFISYSELIVIDWQRSVEIFDFISRPSNYF
ncbi:MAG: hypothetical protein PHD51_04320 [Patescibacteria group bacterium]|nr:hypothetical protein [Patescibacteria group bacterium]MDD5490849.1 hypothetical protein [Patescibacteria group bacterium]